MCLLFLRFKQSMIKRLISLLTMAVFAACNTSDDNQNNDTPANTLPAPQPITFSIDTVLPHDTDAFTQGLQFYNGKLYEGTGQLEETTLRIVDPKTGTIEKKHLITDKTIFGEGITIFNNKLN